MSVSYGTPCATGAGTVPFHLLKCLVHSPIHGELVLLSLVSQQVSIECLYFMSILYLYILYTLLFILTQFWKSLYWRTQAQ